MFHFPTSIKKIEEIKNLGRFEIEGLYPGYGTTIGNALRRVLISSIEGAAVAYFKIKRIQHEFSTIPHVVENVLEIMLNLKQLRIKLTGQEAQILKMSVKGEKEIKAEDFEQNPLVTIMNPDLHLFTITDKKGEVEIEVTVERGLGYVLAEERKKEKLPIGTIAVDAIFSPVRKTNFKVENMRVKERTDYNRLVIEIETDGSVSPSEALGEAASILSNHFSLIKEKFAAIAIGEEFKEPPSVFKKEKKEPKEVLIENLDLSPRTKKALANNGIKTLASLLRYKLEKLAELEGLGEKSLEEIKKVLKGLEYALK